MRLARPAAGPITSPFGPRRIGFHNGIDFGWLLADPTGSKRVRSAHPGTVVDAGYSSAPGNYVLVDIGGGYKLRYIHLSRIDVTVGQKVAYSTPIGVMGDSGTSTSPGQVHLHFDLYSGTNRINPEPYLEFPYGYTGPTFAGGGATPIEPEPVIEEEEDMKPKVFERVGSATREAMVVAPWVVGSSSAEKGYRVLLTDAEILAAERMYAKGSGTADRVDRDGYVAVQDQARKDHAAWGSGGFQPAAVDLAPVVEALNVLPAEIRAAIFK